MRKTIALILCIALAMPLFGCAGDQFQTPGLFYYRRSTIVYDTEEGVIAPEQREVASLDGDIGAILEAYFSGPESSELEAPFPRDSQILSWLVEGNTLILTMNDAFGALSGVELTIACTCITRTLLGLVDLTQVQFRMEDALLGGEKSITLSGDNVSLSDDSLDQSRAEFTLYYTDRDQRYLIAEEVSVNLATEDDLVTFLVESLLTPPEDSNLLSALPGGTKLLDYSIDDGLCTINFSEEFERNGWNRCEAQRLTLLSVVNTLTQLEEIQQVEFCTEGNLLVQYRLLSISAPLVFEENAIGPVRTGMNEFDATLFLVNGSEQYLAAVPTPVRQTSGISHAELVVKALLEHTSVNGFLSTIPEGTVLNDLQIRNGICYVDLSAQFLSSEDHLVQSVHSIVASVCALDDVYSAQVTVDGQIPEGEYAHLFVVLSPKSDWFL